MIIIKDKANCCGCEACVQVCPKHCISFEPDSEGFYYPKVEKEGCVNCGLCEKVCPVINTNNKRSPLVSMAAMNKNENERIKSSSGGIFILLATYVINNGGIVFGAKFDDDFSVIHSYTDTIEGITPFLGSKYVQSRIGNNYLKAQEFLKAGRLVLFSGTPCQISGLKKFLRKDYDKLITVDVICHGVPSPAVWQQYLEEIKDNARKGENSVSLPLNPPISGCDAFASGREVKIEGITFRDKRLGWKKFSFALTLAEATADGKKNTVSLSHIHDNDPYFLGFNDYNLYLRPSCMKCPTRDLKSGSDITLADFWNIESLLPDFDDDKGVSVVLANTEKGVKIVDSLKLNRRSVSYQDVVCRNTSIKYNSKPLPSSIFDIIKYKVHFNSKRDYFFYDKNNTVSTRVKILGRPSLKSILLNIVRVIYHKLFRG